MPESSTAQCEQGAGRGFLPAEQGIVPKKDGLAEGDRAQSLEVGPQYGTSRSFSHCSCSFTFDPEGTYKEQGPCPQEMPSLASATASGQLPPAV